MPATKSSNVKLSTTPNAFSYIFAILLTGLMTLGRLALGASSYAALALGNAARNAVGFVAGLAYESFSSIQIVGAFVSGIGISVWSVSKRTWGYIAAISSETLAFLIYAGTHVVGFFAEIGVFFGAVFLELFQILRVTFGLGFGALFEALNLIRAIVVAPLSLVTEVFVFLWAITAELFHVL